MAELGRPKGPLPKFTRERSAAKVKLWKPKSALWASKVELSKLEGELRAANVELWKPKSELRHFAPELRQPTPQLGKLIARL